MKIFYNNKYVTIMTTWSSQNINFLCWRIAQKCWTVYQIIFLFSNYYNNKIDHKKSAWFNIFPIQNFTCNIFTGFPIIITRNWPHRFLCHNTDTLRYHWLSHFPVTCQRLVLHFSLYYNMLQDICDGNLLLWRSYHPRSALQELLCLQFLVQLPHSIFRCTWKVWRMCSFISLSSWSEKKQVGVKFFKLILLRLNFICVSVLSKNSTVSILPCSASCSFSNSFFLFPRQFGLILFSNAIFMKDGFYFL